MHFLAISLLVIPIWWVYAEFKMSRRVRITLGVLSFACVGFVVHTAYYVRNYYEDAWHRTSIRDATDLIRKGNTNAVLAAFETYSSGVATGSTFRASEKMMKTLSREMHQP
jgi:hypothetical protein